MASVEELPPETGAHSEGFATPIGGGLPSESGDVVAHDLQEQFRGELLQLDEKYPGLGGIFADALPDLPADEDMLRRTKAELGAAAVKFNPDALLDIVALVAQREAGAAKTGLVDLIKDGLILVLARLQEASAAATAARQLALARSVAINVIAG